MEHAAQEQEAPRCCGHCLHDLPCALTYALCDATRRSQPEPYQPWWPASIDSPTRYFQLKRRAMEQQCRQCFSNPATWRATSASGGAGSPLRARRGLRQLSVHIPTARTNVGAGDGLEYMGALGLKTPPAQQQPAPMQQHAMMQAAQQQPAMQQQQGTAPNVLRPRARRAVPLPPAAPAGQPQPHLTLLASLQYHEHCHRQQLATAAAAPLWAGFHSVADAHPAALPRPKWHAGWGDELQQLHEQQQQQQQQAFFQQQQQQAAAAAAAAEAATAAWPYSVPRPHQGWAFGSQLAPVAPLPQPASAAC